jgi:preprotein translocase subunit SecG
MYTALIVIICILAVLLILAILIQNPKGGGLAGEFGSAGASQMFGVKRTTDIVEQATWGFAIAIATLALVSKFVLSSPTTDASSSENIEKAAKKSVPTAAPAPTAPAPTPAPAPSK